MKARIFTKRREETYNVIKHERVYINGVYVGYITNSTPGPRLGNYWIFRGRLNGLPHCSARTRNHLLIDLLLAKMRIFEHRNLDKSIVNKESDQ